MIHRKSQGWKGAIRGHRDQSNDTISKINTQTSKFKPLAVASEQLWEALTRSSPAEDGDRLHVDPAEGPANTSIRSCVMQEVQTGTDNRVVLVVRVRSCGREATEAFESSGDLNDQWNVGLLEYGGQLTPSFSS